MVNITQINKKDTSASRSGTHMALMQLGRAARSWKNTYPAMETILSHYSLYLPRPPANSCLLSLFKQQMTEASLDAVWLQLTFFPLFFWKRKQINAVFSLQKHVELVHLIQERLIQALNTSHSTKSMGQLQSNQSWNWTTRGRTHVTLARRQQFALQSWTILVNF